MLPQAQAVLDEPSARHTAILDAAERSFTRAGFHRTTMQDVAREAGMSTGNLYRYFPSKDAIVAGLCERDRAGLFAEFAAMRGTGGSFMQAFRALGERHFDELGRDKAKLCLEIWAEATRNPAIAAMQTDFDRSFEDQLVSAFEAARDAGEIAPGLDLRAIASIVGKLGDGLFVRRAVASDFDPRREVAEVFAVICALMQGAVSFSSPPACNAGPATETPS